MKQPATLLAESLSQPGGEYSGGFGVKLTDLVAAVVVFGVSEIGIAPFSLAPRGVARTGFVGRSSAAVEPVHELVLGGGEIGPAAEVEANSGHEVHGGTRRGVLALRDYEIPGGAAPHGGAGYGVEGE